MNTPSPKRGEIWLVDLNPTRGAEIQKQRPAVVISSDAVGKLPVKLIAPITEWQATFGQNVWHVQLAPTQINGLSKVSAVDALQIRSVSTERFLKRWGRVTENDLAEIAHAVAAVIELE